jgi:hypothetical protein
LDGFEGFGVEKGKVYQGTVFRLPLRLRDDVSPWAEESDATAVDSVLKLLQDFGPRISDHILFLRNVDTIKLSVWHDKQPHPRILHVARMGKDGCDFRQRCFSLAQELSADDWRGSARLVSSRITIYISHGVSEAGERAAAHPTVGHTLKGKSLSGGSSSDLATDKAGIQSEDALHFFVVYGCGGEWCVSSCHFYKVFIMLSALQVQTIPP